MPEFAPGCAVFIAQTSWLVAGTIADAGPMTSSRGRGRLEKTLPPLPFPTAGAFSESLQLRRKSMGKVFYLIEDAGEANAQSAELSGL